jgi:hypothetical protein
MRMWLCRTTKITDAAQEMPGVKPRRYPGVLCIQWFGHMAHAVFGLRVNVKPSFFSKSRTLDAMETDSCMPTTAPQLAQQTAPTSTREPVGLIGMDANSVPSHFGHFGVTDFIIAERPNDPKLSHADGRVAPLAR